MVAGQRKSCEFAQTHEPQCRRRQRARAEVALRSTRLGCSSHHLRTRQQYIPARWDNKQSSPCRRCRLALSGLWLRVLISIRARDTRGARQTQAPFSAAPLCESPFRGSATLPPLEPLACGGRQGGGEVRLAGQADPAA